MAYFKEYPQLEIIPSGGKFFRYIKDWRFYSEVLNRWCIIPAGFVFDLESIPLYRGENPIAGGAHDYFCRKDSIPVVSKFEAAQIYKEVQEYEDSLCQKKATWLAKIADWWGRMVKRDAVILVPDEIYWHKYRVMATYEEIS